MKQALVSIFVGIVVLYAIRVVEATPKIHSDIIAHSSNGQYQLAAKSPANQKNGGGSLGKDYIYTCTDTKAKKVIWTRNQAMVEADEGGPSVIFVNNAGWGVIQTFWDELIAVDPTGKDRGRIEIIDDAFTSAEKEKYVVYGSGGPFWSGLSHSYFAEHGNKTYFVVRPWWGNHVVVDLDRGKLVKKNDAFRKTLLQAERKHVVAKLQECIATRKTWEDGNRDSIDYSLTAAHLAGRLQVKQAIPLLHKLEGSPCVTSFSSCGSNGFEPAEGELDPFDWETMEVRQVVHLSLRRLGEIPGPYPCTRFRTAAENYDEQKLYKSLPLKRPRSRNVDRIRPDILPEAVVALLSRLGGKRTSGNTSLRIDFTRYANGS